MRSSRPATFQRLRGCIRTRRYVVTLHAEEEIDNDDLSIFDVERAILTGEIIERQKDQRKEEWKYLVRGKTIEGRDIVLLRSLVQRAR